MVKAFQATAPLKMEKMERSVSAPAADHLTVRMRSFGICGYDLHLLCGDHPYTIYPIIFGHEAAGMVESVEQEVEHFKEG